MLRKTVLQKVSSVALWVDVKMMQADDATGPAQLDSSSLSTRAAIALEADSCLPVSLSLCFSASHAEAYLLLYSVLRMTFPHTFSYCSFAAGSLEWVCLRLRPVIV